MSRSITAPYRIEYTCSTGGITNGSWFVRTHGRFPGMGQPNVQMLKMHLYYLQKSFEPGGCNDHCGPVKITGARIVDQRTGEVRANWSD